MSKYFKISLIVFGFFTSIGLLFATDSSGVPMPDVKAPGLCKSLSDLVVTKTSSTSVTLSWVSSGSGDYLVTITNLTTSQVEQRFSTSLTSASVSGLTSGHAYRFQVEQNGYVIAEDLVM